MSNLHNEFYQLKKSMKIQAVFFISIILIAVLACFSCYKLGYNKSEREILQRAKMVIKPGKTCYEVQDIEIIIFNESQL